MSGRKYLDWVKGLPCAVCGDDLGVDPHHILGTKDRGASTKVPDVWAVPLCRLCHDGLHQDPLRFEMENGFSQQLAALRTIARAVFEGRLVYGD